VARPSPINPPYSVFAWDLQATCGPSIYEGHAYPSGSAERAYSGDAASHSCRSCSRRACRAAYPGMVATIRQSDFLPDTGESAEGIRDKLLDGLAPYDVFAAGAGRSIHSIRSWVRQGLPTRRIGNRRYVRIDDALEWIRRRFSDDKAD
jgi:hypothetical protein